MLDGHEYLAKRGWKGKGTALRSGGIAKPLTVTQKRTLSGLGKDRDEAFPFWEHVYNTSVGAIKIKLDDSDTGSEDDDREVCMCVLYVTLRPNIDSIEPNYSRRRHFEAYHYRNHIESKTNLWRYCVRFRHHTCTSP